MKIDQIGLKAHQQKQIDFLHSRLRTNHIVGISSPTGSGKTVTAMKYIAEKKAEAKSMGRPFNVVFSTGFNVLVDQVLSVTENLFGLTRDPYCINNDGSITLLTHSSQEFSLFTLTGKNTLFCNQTGGRKLTDQEKSNALYGVLEELKNINSPTSKFVVTNHTCLWMYKSVFAKYDLIIVDEVHTYPMFQEMANTLEISGDDLKIMEEIVQSRAKIGNPHAKAFLTNLKLGKISNRSLNFLSDDEFIDDLGTKLGGTTATAKRFLYQFHVASQAKNSIDQFCAVTDNSNLRWVKFQKCSDLYGPQIICLSATIDTKTREFMGIGTGRNNYFQEDDSRFYQGSSIHIYPTEENEYELAKKMAEVIRHTPGSGIIYSTTLSFIQAAKATLSKVTEVHTSVDSFQNSSTPNKVLIGSTKFSMGIDLPGVDYLFMNRIPFDRYDEEYRAKQVYFESVIGRNSWVHMSMADVENRMVQLIGRLWRNYKEGSTSKKKIVIWDSRFIYGNKTYHGPLLEKIKRPGMKEVIHNV